MKICTGKESDEELQKRFETFSMQDRKRAVDYCGGKGSPECASCPAKRNPYHVCSWMLLFKERPTDWIVTDDNITLRKKGE